MLAIQWDYTRNKMRRQLNAIMLCFANNRIHPQGIRMKIGCRLFSTAYL